MHINFQDANIASISSDTGTVHSRGIARWDKIAQIAQVLVGLEGLSVSEEEAGRIKSLWDSLQGSIQGARAPFLTSNISLMLKRSKYSDRAVTLIEQSLTVI